METLQGGILAAHSLPSFSGHKIHVDRLLEHSLALIEETRAMGGRLMRCKDAVGNDCL